MSGPVVVDSRLAIRWLVNEIDSNRAQSLAASWAREALRPVVPYMLPVKVGNALHRRLIRKELSPADATRLLDTLLLSGIEPVEPPGVDLRALEIASSLGQPAVYDVHYLAVAQRMGCELWPADERFFPTARGRYPNVRWIAESVDDAT